MNRQREIAPEPELTEEKHRVRLRLALDAWEAVKLPWRRSRALPAAELWETLTFDFRSGRSFFRLEGANGQPFDTCDLSGCCPAGDPLFDRIDRSPALRAALAAAFTEKWGQPLPFAAEELGGERCALLCAFIGYGREFYDAIPVRRNGLAPPVEFRAAARALHRASTLPALVAGCGLPQMKSVRRALFARPALLFYSRELRTVYAAMPDPNCFCALLEHADIFTFLSALHTYPAVADYYIDLGRAVGSRALLRLLRENRCDLLLGALRYAAMDARSRAQERRAWRLPFADLVERCQPYPHADELGYSLPVSPEADCAVPPLSCVGAYRFERLGSIRDLVAAGTALGNCLAELPSFFGNSTVLAVKKNGAFCAAIHLKNHHVLQALAAHNRPIDADEPLGHALHAWAARHGLQLQEPEEPDIIE